MSTEHNSRQVLVDLGFTEMEAAVYTFLLSEAPATGYRVSHGIGKSTANTYKAISSLQEKGAVIFEQGDRKQIIPVPPDELLAGLERRFSDRKETAVRYLNEISKPVGDENVYRLTTPPQVLERARAMLARTREIVLLDIFPNLVPHLAGEIRAAVARGARVYAITYEPGELAGVNEINSFRYRDTVAAWPGQQLNMVVDAQEHMLSMLSDDLSVVHQAVWSASTYLSCLQHNAIAMEFLVMTTAGDTGEFTSKSSRDAGAVLLGRANPPGLRELNNRFGKPADE